ncbi:MAG: hypothetical protein ACXVFK_14380, partial [Solirubrobacteraceae bacterium]
MNADPIPKLATKGASFGNFCVPVLRGAAQILAAAARGLGELADEQAVAEVELLAREHVGVA